MPPAVALLNYISSGTLWRIFVKLGHFAGFSLHIVNFVGRISEAAMTEVGDIIFHNFGAQRKGTPSYCEISPGLFIYYSPKGSAKLRWAAGGSLKCTFIALVVK